MTKGPCAMRGLLHGPLVLIAPQGRRGIREVQRDGLTEAVTGRPQRASVRLGRGCFNSCSS
jgi:hypothetical protein